MKIDLPSGVKFVLNRLNESHHEAYVVGGCVRDSIMGITPHDWDICTSAKPEQVIELFVDCNVLETGLKHGTVTVVVGKESYEITTYRIDGEYKDSRHPESVEFVSDLRLDLMRRDFTINAMAYNPESGLIDCFDGASDIKNRIIRCVGDPQERFQEDALRIMRVIRFSARFGYMIETKTYESACRNIALLAYISRERIQSEVEKIVNCKYLNRSPATLLVLATDVIAPAMSIIDADYRVGQLIHVEDAKARLALLFNLENSRQILRELKFSNYMVDSIVNIQESGSRLALEARELHEFSESSIFANKNDKADFIMRSHMFGRKQDICHSSLCFAKAITPYVYLDGIYELECAVKRVVDNKALFSMKNLAVNGNDLKGLGFSGIEIGKTLNQLAQMIISGAVRNRKYDLMKIAKIVKGDSL